MIFLSKKQLIPSLILLNVILKGYTALQTSLSVLINAGIAVVKNVFLFLIDRFLSFARRVLNKLVEGMCAFLSEMGDQWIVAGDF